MTMAVSGRMPKADATAATPATVRLTCNGEDPDALGVFHQAEAAGTHAGSRHQQPRHGRKTQALEQARAHHRGQEHDQDIQKEVRRLHGAMLTRCAAVPRNRLSIRMAQLLREMPGGRDPRR
jgi:hypothetical protein